MLKLEVPLLLVVCVLVVAPISPTGVSYSLSH
jgi:hypothetical protein